MGGVTSTSYDRLLEDHRHGSKVRSNGTTATAQCPAHEDRNPSLSLRSIDGSVLLYCHAGCATDDVLAALNLQPSDLYDDPQGAAYRYDDGRTVRRAPDKTFWQIGNTTGTPVLYRP